MKEDRKYVIMSRSWIFGHSYFSSLCILFIEKFYIMFHDDLLLFPVTNFVVMGDLLDILKYLLNFQMT